MWHEQYKNATSSYRVVEQQYLITILNCTLFLKILKRFSLFLIYYSKIIIDNNLAHSIIVEMYWSYVGRRRVHKDLMEFDLQRLNGELHLPNQNENYFYTFVGGSLNLDCLQEYPLDETMSFRIGNAVA